MIERYAARNDVTTSVTRQEVDMIVALEGLKGFGFNQSQFVIRLRLGESALLPGIAVAVETCTRNGGNRFHRSRGVLGFVGDVNGFNFSLPHASPERGTPLAAEGASIPYPHLPRQTMEPSICAFSLGPSPLP